MFKLAFSAVFALFPLQIARAQDLAPRAYLISPLSGNAITINWSFFQGSLDFGGNAIPIQDGNGTYHVPSLTYYHSFSFFGRSANITGLLPYGVGNFQATVSGMALRPYRSGLLDSGFRFAVNLKGGPAMSPPQFARWKQKVLLGASLKVIAPTGQYDPRKLLNWGSNRWGFKPEFGYSQRLGNWILDGYGGVWFFTTNGESFSIPAPQPKTEGPIGSFEGHVSYSVKPRLWFSFDGSYWFGGTTSLGGILNPGTRQTSSRIGGTASLPLNKYLSIKVSYSAADFARFGGNFKNLTIGWQYAWLGKPK
jgi:Putative MetA-pathway of phenol degradation